MTLTERRQAYADIHILAKKLELSDKAYRALLFSLTGQRSCVDLRPTELNKVRSFLANEAAPAPSPTTGHAEGCYCDTCASEILGL